MHFQENPSDNKKLQDIVGDNPLSKAMGNSMEKDTRHESFEAVYTLVDAASDLYCGGDMKFDEMLKNLCEALDKLTGKEKELAKSEEKETEV